jgi:hypothetical protein
MKLQLLLVSIWFCFSFPFFMAFGQSKKQIRQTEKLFKNRTEIHFWFLLKKKEDQKELTRLISIDHVKGDTVWAFASKKGLLKFFGSGYSKFQLLPNSAEEFKQKQKRKKKSGPNTQSTSLFNTYPSYPEYEQFMAGFAAQFPQICQLVNLGTLPSGRKILALKISDSIQIRQNEPRFLYTSTMHGDETVGFPLMLKLIDTLLKGYGNNFRLNRLVNEMEIWINPLANPDGTYRGGNNTVMGASRFNANNVDLNRNFPDPEDGLHPDGEPYQPETKIFMKLADSLSFVMAANFHSGAEVVNYPWDTWQKRPADENWWISESAKFADSARSQAPPNFFSSIYGYPNFPGITQGFEWYEVNGGRQDYMNAFKHCREMTVELSDVKILPANQIHPHWNYLQESLIGFMESSLLGIRGRITDACTGKGIRAKIFVQGLDKDSSHVFSDLPLGNFHRPIQPGSYNLLISSPGYQSVSLTNVGVNGLFPSIQNLQLQPLIPKASFGSSKPTLCSNVLQFMDKSGSASLWSWNFGDGQISNQQNPFHSYAQAGFFQVKLKVGNCAGVDSIVLDSAVSIFQPSEPLAIPDSSFCGAKSLLLQASSTHTVLWYANSVGGNPLDTGSQFLTPPLSSSQTYFAQAQIKPALPKLGPENNTIGSGGFFTANTYHYLIFNAFQSFDLKSVRVFANSAGNRTIQLRNAQGQVISSRVVNIPQGVSRIVLNFQVPKGENYQLGMNGGGGNNLYRNQSGASYPYTLDGLAEITGNSAGNPGFYYFFYDWELATQCLSNRVPVLASVNNANQPAIAISPLPGNLCQGDTFSINAIFQNAINPQFTWLVNGVPSGNDPSLQFSGLPGNFSIRCQMFSDDSCAVNNPVTSSPASLVVVPKPGPPFISFNFPYLISSSGPVIFYTYPDWVRLNTTPQDSLNYLLHAPTISFSAQLVDTNGCKSEFSEPIICISNLPKEKIEIKVWKNGSQIQIESSMEIHSRLSFLNLQGKEFFSDFMKGFTFKKDLNCFPSGLYFLKTEKNQKPFRFIIP